jgi:hypothetical protein
MVNKLIEFERELRQWISKKSEVCRVCGHAVRCHFGQIKDHDLLFVRAVSMTAGLKTHEFEGYPCTLTNTPLDLSESCSCKLNYRTLPT